MLFHIFHADAVRFLVEKGANIHAKNDMRQTPLAMALSACRNINITNMAEISAILLQAGAEVTPDKGLNSEKLFKKGLNECMYEKGIIRVHCYQFDK